MPLIKYNTDFIIVFWYLSNFNYYALYAVLIDTKLQRGMV